MQPMEATQWLRDIGEAQLSNRGRTSVRSRNLAAHPDISLTRDVRFALGRRVGEGLRIDYASASMVVDPLAALGDVRTLRRRRDPERSGWAPDATCQVSKLLAEAAPSGGGGCHQTFSSNFDTLEAKLGKVAVAAIQLAENIERHMDLVVTTQFEEVKTHRVLESF